MRRRDFLSVIAGATAWPFAATAQEPGRTYRVGGLSNGPRAQNPLFVAMFDEARRAGFIEGQNLIVD